MPSLRGKITWKYSQKASMWNPRKEASGKTTLLTLTSLTSNLQSCEELNFCCLSHSVCGISWWPLDRLISYVTVSIFCFLTLPVYLFLSLYIYMCMWVCVCVLVAHTGTHTPRTESLPLEIKVKQRKMCLSINNIYWVWTLCRPLSQVSRGKTGNINQAAQNSGKNKRSGNEYNHGKLLIHDGGAGPLHIVPFPFSIDTQSSYKITSH